MATDARKSNVPDRILGLLGKKRGTIDGSNVSEKYGLYVYFESKQESFWKALFKPRDRELPNA